MKLPSTNSGNKLVLGIRTDTSEATIILFCHPEDEASLQAGRTNRSGPLDQITWAAGRQLSATLLAKIDELLQRNGKSWSDIHGIVTYQGPGSFTGLRIGLTVANTAAFSLNVPIAGSTGEDWLAQGAEKLTEEHFNDIVMPHYGAEPNITKPRK